MKFLICDENKNKSGIYIIKNQINEKIYIGSTRCFRERFNEHKRNLLANIASNYMQNECNKYGIDNFTFDILEITEKNKEALVKKEQFYLDLYYDNQDKCFNLNKLATSRLGTKQNWSEEQRQKHSQMLIDRYKNVEFREKQRKILKERYENDPKVEQCLKIGRDSMKGKPKTEEHKQNLSKARKGKYMGAENPNYGKPIPESHKQKLKLLKQKNYDVKIKNIDGTIYGPIINLNDFCKERNLRQGNMWLLIHGKIKSSQGWVLYLDSSVLESSEVVGTVALSS